MKRLLPVLLFCLLSTPAYADDIVKEMNRVAAEVATLKLGFGDYVLGLSLTAKQKEGAKKNRVAKTLKGTYKFRDADINVVIAQENDVVLGIYKHYPEASMDQVKTVIGDLMLEFGEPTTMAHEKLIYWAFDKDGKISEDVFDFLRQSGGSETLATIKFSSSERVAPDAPNKKGEEKQEKAEQKKPSVYVMITSDPLSKLFLTYTNPQKQ